MDTLANPGATTDFNDDFLKDLVTGVESAGAQEPVAAPAPEVQPAALPVVPSETTPAPEVTAAPISTTPSAPQPPKYTQESLADPRAFQQLISEVEGSKLMELKRADENAREDVGFLRNVSSELVRGAAENLTGLPKFTGALTRALGVTQGELLESSGVAVEDFFNKLAPVSTKYRATEDTGITDSAFWASVVPRGLGLVLGQVAIQLAASRIPALRALSDAKKVAQAEAAATNAGTLQQLYSSSSTYLMGGVEGYDAFSRAIEQGDSPLEAAAKSLGYATIAGGIESKATKRILARTAGMYGETATKKLVEQSGNKAIKEAWKKFAWEDVGKEIAFGSGEEFLQKLSQNIIVSGELSGGLMTEATAGGVVQGLFGAATGLPRLRTRIRTAKENAAQNNAPEVAKEMGEEEAKVAAASVSPREKLQAIGEEIAPAETEAEAAPEPVAKSAEPLAPEAAPAPVVKPAEPTVPEAAPTPVAKPAETEISFGDFQAKNIPGVATEGAAPVAKEIVGVTPPESGFTPLGAKPAEPFTPFGLKPAEPVEVKAPEATEPKVEASAPVATVESKPVSSIAAIPVTEIPVAQLKLSTEVPQFKRSNVGGIVRKLEGEFSKIGTGPIQVWRRLNGDLEVISGRHRWDLAKRSGTETIPAQVHEEAAGFTAQQAATLDAELNIRDEQGSVPDYAVYFRNSGLSRDEATSRGLLSRAKGIQGFQIGKAASDDVFALHQAGKINDAAAAAISDAAPNDARLQAVGLKAALEGKPADYAGNLVKAFAGRVQEKTAVGEETTGDLFGFDDSAIKESEKEAELVSIIQKDLREDIRAVKDAARFPDRAKKFNVTVKNPASVIKAVAELEARLEKWNGSWFLDPELKAQLREMKSREATAEKPKPAKPAAQKAEQVETKLAEQATPTSAEVVALIDAAFNTAVDAEVAKNPEKASDPAYREQVRNEMNLNTDALNILRKDPAASKIVEQFLKDNNITEPTNPSFEQMLRILGASPSLFSRASIKKSVRRAVDISVLMLKARELGVERIIRFGQAVAGIQAFYDPKNDEAVFATDNIDGTEEAIRKLYHEITERNLVLLQTTEEGRSELTAILNASKTELLATIPRVLKESGFKTQEEFAKEYKFESETELLAELMSRYAERLAVRPAKPSWWKTLMAKIQLWLAKHFNVNITPQALEHWLAGNIEKFAAASPGPSGLVYSMGPSELTALDQEYLDAVNRGDTEAAQRMVDAAAKAAGFDIGPVLHGTNAEFTEFKSGRVGAIYFTDDKTYAKRYGKNLISVYLRSNKIGDLTNPKDPAYKLAVKTFNEAGGWSDNEDAMEGRESPNFDPEIDNTWEIFDNLDIDIRPVLQAAGYDAFKLQEMGANENEENVASYVIFEPNKAKSADPVTRDDAGNIIPLSQRFDITKQDIRFSREQTSDEQRADAESAYNMRRPKTPEEVMQAYRYSKSKVARSFEERLQELDKLETDVEKLQEVPELIVHPEGKLNEPTDLWTVLNAAGSVIQDTNEKQNHLVSLVSRLNLNKLNLSKNQDVTAVLVASIDGETGVQFDPATNTIQVAVDSNMSQEDLVAGLLQGSFHAALHNLVTNGIPQVDTETGIKSELATKSKAVKLLTEARNIYDPAMDLGQFVSMAKDVNFRNALFSLTKPGQVNSSAGRYLMDGLYSLLGAEKNNSIAEEVAAVLDSKNEIARFKASERAKAAIRQGTKKTTALKKYLAANPDLQERLKESMYFPSTDKQVLDAANAWVSRFNGDYEDAALAIDSKTETGSLRPQELAMAQHIVGLRLNEMARMAEDIDEPYEAERLRDLSTEVTRKSQMLFSQAGQVLRQAAAIVAGLDAGTVESDIVDPVVKTQEETLKDDSTVTKIKDTTRADVADTAATETVKGSRDVLDTIAGVKPVDSDVKEIVNTLEDTFGTEVSPEDVLPAESEEEAKPGKPRKTKPRAPKSSDLIERVAQYIVKMTMKRLEGVMKTPTKLELEAYLKKVVKEQLADQITIKRSEAQMIRPSDLLLENLDLAERAFDKSKADLLAKTPLSEDQRAEVQKARFRTYDYNKTKTVLKKALKLRDLVRTSLSNQNATLGSFTNAFIEGSGLSPEQATRVAKAIAEVYNEEARAEALKQLEAIGKTRKKGSKVRLDNFEKFLQFFNLGGFNTRHFYNQIALQNPELNLPTFDPDFVSQMRKEADAIQAMPESDVKKEKAMLLMTKIAQKQAQELTGTKKAKYMALEVLPAIWKAGILSGIPTQLVNALGSFGNVTINSAFSAFGFQFKAAKATGKIVDSFGFYKDIFDALGALTGMSSNSSPYNIVFQQAAEMGRTRFNSHQAEQLGALEQIKGMPVLGKLTFLHRWVGRIMAMADGVNNQLGYEILQRQGFRYAMMMNPKMATEGDLMRAFDPDNAAMSKIEAQLNVEKLTGRDRALRRQGLIEQYRQDIVGDEQFLAKSLEPALDWTFNAMPRGLVGAFFEGFASTASRMTLGVSNYFLPFMRTVASITNTCMDFFPGIGILRAWNVDPTRLVQKFGGMKEDSKYYSKPYEFGSPEHIAQVAKGTLGFGVFVGFALLAMMGLDDEEKGEKPYFAIYGSGPTNFLKREEMRKAGFQPRTFRVGNNYFAYNDMPGVSLMLGALGTICDTYRFAKRKEEREPLEIPKLALLGVVNTLFEKNLLSGVANLLEIIQNVDQRGLIGFDRLVTSTAAGFTNPALAKFVGDYVFRTDADGRIITTDSAAQEAFMYALTPMSWGYNKPALDVFGAPITKGRWEVLTRRFFDLGVEDHPIFTPLVRQNLIIPTPSRSTQFYYGGSKHTMSVDNEIYRRFVEIRGQFLASVITPELADRVATIAQKTTKDVGQKILRDIASRAQEVAVRRVQAELISGKLVSEKLNRVVKLKEKR